jgi:hypothetical protein
LFPHPEHAALARVAAHQLEARGVADWLPVRAIVTFPVSWACAMLEYPDTEFRRLVEEEHPAVSQ